MHEVFTLCSVGPALVIADGCAGRARGETVQRLSREHSPGNAPFDGAEPDRAYFNVSSFFLSPSIVDSERWPGGNDSAVAIASTTVLRAAVVSPLAA